MQLHMVLSQHCISSRDGGAKKLRSAGHIVMGIGALYSCVCVCVCVCVMKENAFTVEFI